MLTLEVYGEKPKMSRTLTLKLEERAGEVLVVAVDARGRRLDRGVLMSFSPDGTFTKHECVNPGLGLSLDSSGQIRESA